VFFVRVLIADDHEAVRRGVCAILESRVGLEVCGEAKDGAEAVEKARELQPDLIILDITMPVLGGLAAAREIRMFLPRTPILIFSMHESREMMEEARKIGAQGYVTKQEAGRSLLDAVDALALSQTFFPRLS
jgi:DNA-binding NarL/FixJ family response regulator